VVERFDDMPPDTLGFRCSGEMTVEEIRVILDPIDEILQADGELRLLFVIDDDFKTRDPKVIWEDLKADYQVLVRHRDNVKRTAIVTDSEWLKGWIKIAGGIAPGESKLFAPGELGEAKAWVAG
jgi:hypothetical protein